VLATQQDGQLHAALVTPAVAPDGRVLLLLSALSAHTRQLRAEPRCALLVTGPATGANPQTAPRLCVEGIAAPDPDPAARAYWRMHHPYASAYADFTDFMPWRVRPTAAQFVAGFGRAHRLAPAALMPPESAVNAVQQAAPALIAHCNTAQREALSGIAHSAGHAGAWEMRCLDTDGALLGQGALVLRVAFSAPVFDEAGVRQALGRLLQTAPDRF